MSSSIPIHNGGISGVTDPQLRKLLEELKELRLKENQAIMEHLVWPKHPRAKRWWHYNTQRDRICYVCGASMGSEVDDADLVMNHRASHVKELETLGILTR